MRSSYHDDLRAAAAEFNELWARRLRRLSICPLCGKRVHDSRPHTCPTKKPQAPCRECGAPSLARKLCPKHYHQWYRRKLNKGWLTERAKPTRRICIRCKQREVKAHKRCIPCYHRYRKENPNQCDCGQYYKRGTKCTRCYKRDSAAKHPRCVLCAKRPRLLKDTSGLCRPCLNSQSGVICQRCDGGRPVVDGGKCRACKQRASRSTELGKRNHRRLERARSRKAYGGLVR